MQDSQWLYNAPMLPSTSSPARLLMCTRHDVDGLLWAPSGIEDSSGAAPLTHVATLQAFGYVLASKRNRRFVSSPPAEGDGVGGLAKGVPFVAVADLKRHVYVYWQPRSNPGTQLRYRGTGDGDNTVARDVHVAWQQLVSLEGEEEEVIGFAALQKPFTACIVATKKRLHLICLEE